MNDLPLIFDLVGIAFLLSVTLTPLVRKAALRFDLVDHPDGRRKLHAEPVPRIGGIAVTASYVLAYLLVLLLPYRNLDLDLHRTMAGGIALAPAVAVIFATGLLDDLVGLRPWHKLLGQTVAAVMAYMSGFGFYTFHGHPIPMWIGLTISVVWLIGSANALNLIDGMDGLAAGVGLCACLATLVAAVLKKSTDLALVAAPLSGSLLGFLRYNFNPASIFLGDCGSLVIGFLLGCYGALWSSRAATSLGMIAPLVALCVPLADVLISIVRRFLRGRPIFGADRGHIHHRLLDHGLTPRMAALLLYGVSALAACVSVCQELTASQVHIGAVVLFVFIVWLGISRLNYPEFGVAHRMLFGRLRQRIDKEILLQQFSKSLSQAADVADIWAIMHAEAKNFGIAAIELHMSGRSYEAVLIDREHRVHPLRVEVPLGMTEWVSFTCVGGTKAPGTTVEGFAAALRTGITAALKRPDFGQPKLAENTTCVPA